MHYRGVVLGFALLLAFGVDAWAKTPIRPAVELDQLLGPIALYPDPVLAQILPAATAPEDLELAVKFLEDGGTLDQVDAQPQVGFLARPPERPLNPRHVHHRRGAGDNALSMRAQNPVRHAGCSAKVVCIHNQSF